MATMDPQTDLPDLVEDLEVNIDELSAALSPLLSTPLSTTASSLPLLDKAKLYVLAAYSIESLLFSTLQASGVNAKDHAIFPELARLKGYFGKIKEIEERGVKGSAEGRAKLDVGAAQRFIKHGLAGNEKYDLERRERQAKEKARAAIKAKQINKKFDDEGQVVSSEGATAKKRTAEEVVAEEEATEAVPSTLSSPPAEPATKKPRVSAADLMDIDSAPSPSSSLAPEQKTRRKQRAKKSAAAAASASASDSPSTDPKKRRTRPKNPTAQDEDQNQDADTPSTEARKSRRRKPKSAEVNTEDEEAILPPQQAEPKSRSAAFNALMRGEVPGGKARGGKGRGRGRGK